MAMMTGIPLAADLDRLYRGEPASLNVLLERFVITLRDGYLSVLECAPFLIARGIGGKDHIEGHLLRFIHHHQSVILGKILEYFRLEQLFDTQLLEKKEHLISRIHQQVTHTKTPPSFFLEFPIPRM
ncbi:MAG: hypothetical protein KJ814_11070 [Proteobacteria bacterium]|nr:hypothetical protein [Pseudomonadota bacterium]